MEPISFLQKKEIFEQRFKQTFLSGKKNLASISVLLFLFFAIPLGLWLLQRTQIFAPYAEVVPIELLTGGDSCVVSASPGKVTCPTFPIKLTSPLGPKFVLGSPSPSPSPTPEGSASPEPSLSPSPSASASASASPSVSPSPSPSGPVFPQSGLISYWNMDEASGNTVNDLVGSNDGVATGTTISTVGKIGNARTFTWATTDKIDIPNNASLSPQNITISAWVKPRQAGNGYYASIFNRRNTLNEGGISFEYNGSAGPLQCIVWASAGATDRAYTTVDITVNQWNHVVCTYDGSNIRIFVNGQASGIAARTGSMDNPSNQQTVIGRNIIHGGGQSLDGWIDELGIWNRALSPNEVTSLYNNGSGLGYSQSQSSVWNQIGGFFSKLKLPEVFAQSEGPEGVSRNGWMRVTHNPCFIPLGQSACRPYQLSWDVPINIPDPVDIRINTRQPTWQSRKQTVSINWSAEENFYVYSQGQEVDSLILTAVRETAPSPSPLVSPSSSPVSSAEPSSSPESSPSTSPSPVSSGGTISYKLAESEAGLANAQAIPYENHPTITNFTFSNASFGSKQIWAQFIGPNDTIRTEHISVEIIEPDPVVTSLDCSIDLSKQNLKLTLKGSRLGGTPGKITANGKDAQIVSWSPELISATIKPSESLEDGKLFKVILTKADNRGLPEITCQVNTALISLGARLFCREPGNFDVTGVKVTLVDENGNKADEVVTINKDGVIQGLKTKLQVGKTFVLSVKAPNSLRRNAQFVADNGTNVIAPIDSDTFILPIGDIAPVILNDGKINTLDRSEIIRQWSILGTGTKNSGDFNKDSRINSIDWACMRYDFNKEDEVIPAKAQSTPSPSASPVSSQTPAPSSSGAVSPTPQPSGQRQAYFLLAPTGSGSYTNGAEFGVNINIWSQNEAVNLLVAKLSFDPAKVEVLRIDKGVSLSNWAEEFFDNQTGEISLVAGIPSPGLKTTQGADPLMATIILKGKNTGLTEIKVISESKIYSNSDNVNILSTLGSSQIEIK